MIKKMYTIDVSLQKYIFKEVLAMTGTETFTVLSSENLYSIIFKKQPRPLSADS